MKIRILLFGVFAVTLSACKEGNSSDAQREIAALRAEVEKLKRQEAAPSKPSPQITTVASPSPAQVRELSREEAKKLLDVYLAEKPATLVAFTPEGFRKADTDRLIIPGSMFTKAGEARFRSILRPGDLQIFVSVFGTEDNHHEFRGRAKHRVQSITGVVNNEQVGAAMAEYVAEYVFPEEMESSYFKKTRQDRAMFQRYDSGWRVTRGFEQEK